MAVQNTLKLFVKYLSDWYCDAYNVSQDSFLENNDIDKLKFMKLAFFVAASRKEDSALLKDRDIKFHALQYGPVELDWYDLIKDNESPIQISNYSLTINFNKEELQTLIDDGIEQDFKRLREINSELIKYDSFKLVDLSHKWLSWKSAYKIAELKGQRKEIIEKSTIINDFQYYR